MKTPSKINYCYILLIMPGELIIDFFSYIADFTMPGSQPAALIPIYLLIFGFWQLFIGPIYDKYGIKSILIIHILIYILGGILNFFGNQEISFFAKILEVIGVAAAQVAYYSYLCFLNEKVRIHILIIHKGIASIILLFIPLITNMSLEYDLLLTLNLTCVVVGVCYLIYILLKTDALLEQKVINNQTLLNLYKSYFKRLVTMGFIYHATCVILSQLLIFAFYSHPMFYFELGHSFCHMNYIIIPAFIYFIHILYMLLMRPFYSLCKINKIYSCCMSVCALIAIVNHKLYSVVDCAVVYLILYGSLIFLITNMIGLLSQNKKQASMNITLLGFVESLFGSGASMLYFNDYRMTFGQYSICLYLSGLFIFIFTLYFNISDSQR